LTTLQIGIICFTVLALASIAAGTCFLVLVGREKPVSLELDAQVVVHTTDKRSIKGYVVHEDPQWIRLGGPVYLEGGAERPIGGTAKVPKTSVSWVQDLAGIAQLSERKAVA
jgi:hypothetical protein